MPRILRTRWFSSAISSSWRALACWRSAEASSASRSTTSIRVARSVSAMRSSDVVNGFDLPWTSSFHSSKLSRGVSRGPLGPNCTGLCGSPPQRTARTSSERNSTT